MHPAVEIASYQLPFLIVGVALLVLGTRAEPGRRWSLFSAGALLVLYFPYSFTRWWLHDSGLLWELLPFALPFQPTAIVAGGRIFGSLLLGAGALLLIIAAARRSTGARKPGRAYPGQGYGQPAPPAGAPWPQQYPPPGGQGQ